MNLHIRRVNSKSFWVTYPSGAKIRFSREKIKGMYGLWSKASNLGDPSDKEDTLHIQGQDLLSRFYEEASKTLEGEALFHLSEEDTLTKITVLAYGDITLPNGKRKGFQDTFTLYPSPKDILGILSSGNNYVAYSKLYGDPKLKLLKWIREREAEGFTVEWLSEG
jgi:hypothetical protein